MDLWSIQLLNVDGSTPGTLTLRCTESTPPHGVRTAMTTQLGIYIENGDKKTP
jgi:hypothetical protein